MNSMIRSTILGLIVTTWAGCSSATPLSQLERVAKDWSMAIRASQIIPVYPLTEDLQPGDVFLVQIPIDKQQDLYEGKGFLPLDNMITRIAPTNYAGFYKRSFEVGGADKLLPHYFMEQGKDGESWGTAPNASFPTYSFSVRSGGGVNLAVPVQGVPIGLSLLNSDAGQGTIMIADARTYGVDTVSLYQDILQWAKKNREFLASYAPHGNDTNYLRVITRVYLARRLNVSFQSSHSFGGEGSAGAPKPVELSSPIAATDPQQTTTEAYKNRVNELNAMIGAAVGTGEKLLPGGTIKVIAASARTVSLVETFNRPLVVGYLGFDMEIERDGGLGPPIPTHAILKREVAHTHLAPNVELSSNASLGSSYQVLLKRQTADSTARSLVEDLNKLGEELVPKQYPCAIMGHKGAGTPLSVLKKKGDPMPAGQSGFRSVTTYRGELLTSIENLQRAHEDRQIEVEGYSTRTPEADAYVKEQLSANREALRALDAGLRQHGSLLNRTVDYANQFGLTE